MKKDNKVCLVIGAGRGIGGAVGKKFAQDGFHACLVRRSDGEQLKILVDSITLNLSDFEQFASDDLKLIDPSAWTLI